MSSNRLRLNADKTQFMWLGTSHFLGRRNMQAVSSILQSSDIVNILRVYLDSGLVMDRQVSKLCQVCYFHLHRLRTVRRSLTKELLLTLVHAFVTSQIDHCNGLLLGSHSYLLDRLGWSWTSPSSATYQLQSATSYTGFQSGEGSISRSPLWSVTAWLVLSQNTWWNCAILLAQLSVDNVFGRLLVVTSLFRGFGFRHSAIGPSLSQAPKFGTLSRSGSDNRVTIYCFSNRNWKRIRFSSSERFCGSISNEEPYKFSILLILLLLLLVVVEFTLVTDPQWCVYCCL